MMTLSTNCTYAEVYQILDEMELELSISTEINWKDKSEALKNSIRTNFWNEQTGLFNYLIDENKICDYQEGMGLAFSILFDIANEEQKSNIFENMHVEKASVPCLYPSFPRYKKTVDSYGRHSGTVWPHVQGFWADACMKNNNFDGFLYEFQNLAKHAVRDNQFVEIYHPTTGMPYGGLQEPNLEEELIWFCAERQTWSATAYLRMILRDIIGMEFRVDGIEFQPFLPEDMNTLEFGDFYYLNQIININIKGSGNVLKTFKVNGVEQENFISNSIKGNLTIEMVVGD